MNHDKRMMSDRHLAEQDSLVNCSLRRWHQHTARFINRMHGAQPKPVPYKGKA